MEGANSAGVNHNGNNTTYDPRPKIVGRIIILAFCLMTFTIMLFLFFVHICVRRHLRRRAMRRMHERRLLYLSRAGAVPDVPASNPGLDPAVLKSLPVFTFSAATSPDKERGTAAECPVCLSEFQEDEQGRTLPGCKHSFHVDCIDTWFYSHSTCPVCRSPVEPGATATSCSPRQVGEENTSPPPSSSASASSTSSSASSSSPPPPPPADEENLKASMLKMLLLANILGGDLARHYDVGGAGGGGGRGP